MRNHLRRCTPTRVARRQCSCDADRDADWADGQRFGRTSRTSWLWLLCSALVFSTIACGPGEDTGDGAVDRADAGDVAATADRDTDSDAGGTGDFDGGATSALGTTRAPPPVIVRQGTAGLLLRGIVLTPEKVLDPGEVLIIDDKIACVAVDCSKDSRAASATIVQTNGTISPGLIDCHNHMSYNFLPEWVPKPAKVFNNRYEWSDDPAYEKHILPYAKNRSKSSHFCPASKWAELRSLVHGTTTMQGQPSAASSCIDGLVRNPNRYHGLGYDFMRGTISSPREIVDTAAASLVKSFTSTTKPITRYHVHMAEGFSGKNLEKEFDSFAGRDPRKNRHNGTSLLSFGTAVLIHAVILTDKQLQEVKAENAMVVWSPSSNFALYGYGADKTAPIAKLLDMDIVTGIGPDWTISGEDELLSELRVCHKFGRDEKVTKLTTQKLWQMVTEDGATVVGLQGQIGQLVVGERADISVFSRRSKDPYLTVIDSRAADVRLVLINGAVFYGDATLKSLGRNDYCENLDACGTPKFICVSDSPSAKGRKAETMANVKQQLTDLLNGTGKPPFVEIYNRGSDLQPLITCKQ